MSNKSSFMMDSMFAEEPGMQKLEEEGQGLVFNLLDRCLDAITRPYGSRDVGGLATFQSMKVEM